MSIHIATLHEVNEWSVELWSSDYNSDHFWLVYEHPEKALDDRIDLSKNQLKELLNVVQQL